MVSAQAAAAVGLLNPEQPAGAQKQSLFHGPTSVIFEGIRAKLKCGCVNPAKQTPFLMAMFALTLINLHQNGA